MKRRKLLIATTNEGKLSQIVKTLGALPFSFISINDIDISINPPDEDASTLEGNAIIKARAYGKATGLLTLADDTGLFIDALDGWPGIYAGRVAATSDEQCALALKKMENISDEERGAEFRSVVALYDPDDDTVFLSNGKMCGEIAYDIAKMGPHSHGFNRVFHLPEVNRRFSSMEHHELKKIKQHRELALNQTKYYLQNQYGGKHLVVPIAIIVRDGKILMNKRNDPHNPEFHEVWEFPGGTVELGEDIFENVVRECKEETGYDIEPLEQLPTIRVKTLEIKDFIVQVYLVPVVCKLVGGDGVFSDDEVLEMQWYTPEEIPSLKLFPGDGHLITEYKPMISDIIKKYNL
jgi:XTP/dITP diphosphohydrolase